MMNQLSRATAAAAEEQAVFVSRAINDAFYIALETIKKHTPKFTYEMLVDVAGYVINQEDGPVSKLPDSEANAIRARFNQCATAWKNSTGGQPLDNYFRGTGTSMPFFDMMARTTTLSTMKVGSDDVFVFKTEDRRRQRDDGGDDDEQETSSDEDETTSSSSSDDDDELSSDDGSSNSSSSSSFAAFTNKKNVGLFDDDDDADAAIVVEIPKGKCDTCGLAIKKHPFCLKTGKLHQ